MPQMQFGTTSYERKKGSLPRLPVVNMYAEPAPTEEAGISLQSRPGLVDLEADMGAGPVLQLFQRDGVLDGALFGVSAGNIYRGTTVLGTISGNGAVSIAGNEAGVVFCAGQVARYWNGVTMANVAMLDGAYVRKVFTGASRFFFIRNDTGKIYWTPPLALTIDALDFATAESLPDKLLDGLWIDNGAVLFGSETVEFWPSTGDATLPIAPLQGRVFEVGIKATGCATTFDASFCWVGSDNVVYTNGSKPVRMSDEGLEEKIAATTECALWSFTLEGGEYLALRVDEGTWIYSSRSGGWSEMRSYGYDNWVPRCFAAGVFGSAYDGRTIEFGDDFSDFGGELTRLFRAGLPINSKGVFINNIGLRVDVGHTSYVEGPFADPVVEVRTSRDAGQTWGNFRQAKLGMQGKYRQRVQWRGFGLFGQPGILAEFRVGDPVPFRISGVLVNEPYGGR